MVKTKVKEVVLIWAEGVQDGKYPKKYKSIREANKQVLKNANASSTDGGYDKHKFMVTWEDGYEYTGRLDVKHPSQKYPDLKIGEHIKETLKYMEEHDEGMDTYDYTPKQFLAKYDLRDF